MTESNSPQLTSHLGDIRIVVLGIRDASHDDTEGRYECGRCDGRSDSYQGHFWKYCKVTHKMEKFHFCCPEKCELT